METYLTLQRFQHTLLQLKFDDLPDKPNSEQLVPFFQVFHSYETTWQNAFQVDFSTMIGQDIKCKLIHSRFVPEDISEQGACICWFGVLLTQGLSCALVRVKILVFQQRILLYVHLEQPASLVLPQSLLEAPADFPLDFYKLYPFKV